VSGVWGDPAQALNVPTSDRPGIYESLTVTTPPHLGLDGPRQGKLTDHIAELRGDRTDTLGGSGRVDNLLPSMAG
jgi:hypothetical protein